LGAQLRISETIENNLQNLKRYLREQRNLSATIKNQVLENLASALLTNSNSLLVANLEDLKLLPVETPNAFRDRLTLNSSRIQAMAESLRQVAALADPVNELVDERVLANGLKLFRRRSPLGMILMIFESRPNVILEAFSLAFKSGNAIVLRGGSESAFTAKAIYKLMSECLLSSGCKTPGFYGIEDYDRGLVEHLLRRRDLFDVAVPRGGEKLIELVQKTALMPIIKNDRGLCHAYVDEEADLEMALNIVVNAKTQRPGVCNSLETVLVHKKVAEKFIPLLYRATELVKLQWRVDSFSFSHIKNFPRVELAKEENWQTEYLDLILNCKVVNDLEHAVEHIERFGSRHSETIITANEQKARQFQNEVDSAAVYWNASTRFTDGFEFGLGGELGISTQKLHVRGPVGLKELTTARWIIDGSGQVRE
jgi:glutamate-5-semialdehyde dehydrogenase